METETTILAIKIVLLIIILGILAGYIHKLGMQSSPGRLRFASTRDGFMGSSHGPNVWEVGADTHDAEKHVHRIWRETRPNDM